MTPGVDPIVVSLPDGHAWLRVADAGWDDPLDPTFAAVAGGRWNPPDSFPVLYLCEDVATARAQLHRLFDGWPVTPEDLADTAPYVLVTATLPRRQRVADAVTEEGLDALGLPRSYPVDRGGRPVPQERCRSIGVAVAGLGLRGVRCRSALVADGSGRELAWFPARGARAQQVGTPRRFGDWWRAAAGTGQTPHR